MDVESPDIVIVGGGQAGLSTAEHLRKGGYAGAITIVGAENHAPYQRPPLSKSYLLGETSAERLLLKPLSWYEANRVSLRLGTAVHGIDREGRELLLSDGIRLPYGQLVLATGAAARRFPAAIAGDLAGVYTMRSLADIDAMRHEFAPGRNLLVVGGGYIGLEVAAVARKFGMKVSVVEAMGRILARVASVETAAWVEKLHRANGVDVLVGTGVERFEGDGRVRAATLTNGTGMAVDVIIAGIGAQPETALAEAAGLAVSNGIAVDAMGRTSDSAIWAVGDCACFALTAGPLRLESVGNAIDSAKVVARAIQGDPSPYVPQPWFWSDQYDMKLQIAGCFAPDDRVVVRDVPREGLSHWYFRGGKLVAVDALNAPTVYLMGKRLLEQGLSPAIESLKNPDISLKDIAAMTAQPPLAP